MYAKANESTGTDYLANLQRIALDTGVEVWTFPKKNVKFKLMYETYSERQNNIHK